MPSPAEDVVCLPIKLDAYTLDSTACGTFPKATLAPLAQPNFTWLRLDSALMEADCLPYHDLHNASPASSNPRVTNLSDNSARQARQGVYLHWMLPRIYRSGKAKDTPDAQQATQAPEFHKSPDRWLILRRLHPNSFAPDNVVSSGQMKWVEGWVVESNRIRNITEFGDDVDIELECAPYVVGDASASVDAQAEIFIGAKRPLGVDPNKAGDVGWEEQRIAEPTAFVPLDVAGASNPLFADYTAHNPNVFSIVDNFQYHWPDPSNPDPNDKPLYLSRATASYCVVGWHSLDTEDNLASNPDKTPLATILRQCFLQLMDPSGLDLAHPPSLRAVCHGAMYTVSYNASGNSPDVVKVPAHEAGEKLGDLHSWPVTVGTTPIDAILAYIRAHSGGKPTGTEADILALETLLLKTEDDQDSQQEALDMLTAHNFQPARDSGTHWHFVGAQASDAASGGNPQPTPKSDPAPPPATGGGTYEKTQPVFVPTLPQQQQLIQLNSAQSALDAAQRELKQARWNLFAQWWKFCADGNYANSQGGNSQVQIETTALAKAVKDLQTSVNALASAVSAALSSPSPPSQPSGKATDTKVTTLHDLVEQGKQLSFYMQKDPTILVPGIENPWPVDWLDPIHVRMESQLKLQAFPATLPDGWTGIDEITQTEVPKRLPGAIQGAASLLIQEFFNQHPKDVPGDPWEPSPSNSVPQYHDGRDQWNNVQPYFPLFLEYEIAYYHLGFSYWNFQTPDIDTTHGSALPIRYGIDEKQDITGKTDDVTVIQGRILILPQPGFLLSTNIKRLFLATPQKELPDDLKTDQQQNDFLAKVSQLQYLSAPLTGMIDHLSTLLNGIHIKPTVRLAGQAVQALHAAAAAGQDGGFADPSVIPLMGIDTTKTPYADYIDYPDSSIDPLKPATHGQFKFTRLDVIDKFGQAISAINPAPAHAIPPLYPALSQYFHPQHLKSDPTQAKTVEPSETYAACEFAQFPPTINQETRINASFLHLDPDLKVWRPCTEWENPIWGFVVVNYAEYAIQVFLPDGTFYREARRGGLSGDTVSPKWKPFDPPTQDNGVAAQSFPQLDALITKLKDETYLTAFFDMINSALGSVPHTPDTYAEFLNAVVGRPLALANAGFSLELAAPPRQCQATTSDYPPPPTPDKARLLNEYFFGVKIGDRDRVFDGMVGYFEAQAGAVTGLRKAGDELALDTMLTYFHTPGSTATAPIGETFPLVQPYYISAADMAINAAGDNAGAEATKQAARHWAQLHMIGLLLDPFSPVHLYSGILPVASLSLPSWSLQSAMRRMTAFFHAGPLLVTNGAALVYDPTKKLTADYTSTLAAPGGEVEAPGDPNAPKGSEAAALKPIGLALPAVRSADWNWLGPFAVPPDDPAPQPSSPTKEGDDKKATTTSTTTAATAGAADPTPPQPKKVTEFNPFVLAPLDNAPKFEKGPYMAVEGYLQLKHAITAPDTI